MTKTILKCAASRSTASRLETASKSKSNTKRRTVSRSSSKFTNQRGFISLKPFRKLFLMPTKSKKQIKKKTSHKNKNSLLSKFTIRKWQFITFGILFGVVGSLFLFKSFAEQPVIAILETESLTLNPGTSVVTDSTASNAKALLMTTNATSSGNINLPVSATSLTVKAKGTECRGAPTMSLMIDGVVLINTAVSSGTWASYSATKPLAAGAHSVSISFTNDYSRQKGRTNCSRDLYLDVISFYGAEPVTTTPPPPSAPVQAGAITSAYFGTHILGPLERNINGEGIATAWPSWSPTTVRLWNTYGYSSTKGAYDGISWGSINTANGVYDWTVFDAMLAKHKAQGVTDLIYTFGYTPTWAGGGTNKDQAPSDNTYLSTYATAVARRAIAQGLPIRNWEVWNEPNNGTGTWIGTNAQMVGMAKTIYDAVKAVDPSYKVLTPSPQGNATIWMNGYLAAGGGAYADIMAFHGYTSAAPETIITLIDNYKNVFATHGQSSKPIWDTEAMDLTTSDPTLQAKFLAIYYLLHQAKGVERLYWYAYDADQGIEWLYRTGLNPAGVADVQVHNWMLGAVPGPLSKEGTVYSLPLIKDGRTTLAVWNSAGPSAYASGSYTSYTDLQGVVRTISGNTVTVDKAPILLR